MEVTPESHYLETISFNSLIFDSKNDICLSILVWVLPEADPKLRISAQLIHNGSSQEKAV